MGQFGLDKSAAAGGTKPQHLQQIFAAQWHNSDSNPVIAGGEVSGRGDLRYNYAAGVGLVRTAHGVVYVTWDAGTTALLDQPSVTRTDVVYVDVTGGVFVGVEGAVNEANVCVIDRMVLPGGATATSAAVRARSRNFAMPFGAQLGWLAMFVDPRPQGEAVPRARQTWAQLDFWVPTDRACQIRMHQCVYGQHNAGAPSTDYTNAGIGAMKYWAYLDGQLYRSWEIGYSRIWEARIHNVDFDVTEGAHTLRVERQHVWGNAIPLNFGSAENVWQPASIGIHDEGVRA